MKARIAIIIAVLALGIGGAVWLAADDDTPQESIVTDTDVAGENVSAAADAGASEPTAAPDQAPPEPEPYDFPGEPLLFAWGDGFLELIVHHGAPGRPMSIEAATSTDGVDWQSVPAALPDDLGEGYISSTAVVGQRLVLSFATWNDDGPPADSVVLETQDLVAWRQVRLPALDIPTDLPDYMTAQSQVDAIAAGDAGWVAVRSSFTFFEPEQLLPVDLLEFENGYGIGVTDEGVEFDPDGGERQLFTWDDLGIDPAIGPQLMQEDQRIETWFTPWGGEPIRSEVDNIQWVSTLASNGTEFVLVGHGDTGGSSILRSVDGTTWSPMPATLVGDVNMLAPIEGGYVAQVWRQSGPAIVVTTDGGGTWETVDTTGLPDQEQTSFHLRGSSASPGVATVAFIHEHPAMFEEPVVTYQHEGFEITLHSGPNDASVLIVDLASGATVLEGTHTFPTDEEIRALEESGDTEAIEALYSEGPAWAVHGDGATDYVDPETGDLIVSVPWEVEGEAFNEAYRAIEEASPMDDGPPEMWLVATIDGRRWLSLQLDEQEFVFGPDAAAVNGDLVVVNQGGERIVHSLR